MFPYFIYKQDRQNSEILPGISIDDPPEPVDKSQPTAEDDHSGEEQQQFEQTRNRLAELLARLNGTIRLCVIGSPAAGKSSLSNSLVSALSYEPSPVVPIFPVPDFHDRSRIRTFRQIISPGWLFDSAIEIYEYDIAKMLNDNSSFSFFHRLFDASPLTDCDCLLFVAQSDSSPSFLELDYFNRTASQHFEKTFLIKTHSRSRSYPGRLIESHSQSLSETQIHPDRVFYVENEMNKNRYLSQSELMLRKTILFFALSEALVRSQRRCQ